MYVYLFTSLFVQIHTELFLISLFDLCFNYTSSVLCCSDRVAMETALASWLNAATEHQVDGVVRVCNVLPQRLAEIIRVHRTTNLKTTDLTEAILTVLSEHVEAIPGEMKLSLTRIFLDDVDSACDVQVGEALDAVSVYDGKHLVTQ